MFDFATAQTVDIPVEQYCREYVPLQEPTAVLEAARLSTAYVIFNGRSRRFYEAKLGSSGQLVPTDVQATEADAEPRLAEHRRPLAEGCAAEDNVAPGVAIRGPETVLPCAGHGRSPTAYCRRG